MKIIKNPRMCADAPIVHTFINIRTLPVMLLALMMTILVPHAAMAQESPESSKKPAATSKADPAKEQSIKALEAEQPLNLSTAKADGKAAAEPKKTTSGKGALIRMILGLVVVIATILAVWKLLKWYAKQQKSERTTSGVDGYIDILATTLLSPGRRLHVIRVAGKTVMIGETEHAITHVATISEQTGEAQALPADHMPIAGSFDALIADRLAGEMPQQVDGEKKPLRRFVDGLREATAR